MSGVTKPTRLIALAVLAAGLVGLAAMWFILSPQQSSEPPMILQAEDAGAVDTSGVAEMALGDPDAPVTVIEYASFTCPHCARFHADVLPQLRENYIDTGQVRFIHREVYFDRFGLWASMVARCGGEMRYFGIADMIYDQQSEWTRGNPGEIAESLRRIGRSAGLGQETLEACLSDADTAETLVAWYTKNAEADEIDATPSFVINGEKHSNMSYARLTEVIDGLLAE